MPLKNDTRFNLIISIGVEFVQAEIIARKKVVIFPLNYVVYNGESLNTQIYCYGPKFLMFNDPRLLWGIKKNELKKNELVVVKYRKSKASILMYVFALG